MAEDVKSEANGGADPAWLHALELRVGEAVERLREMGAENRRLEERVEELEEMLLAVRRELDAAQAGGGEADDGGAGGGEPGDGGAAAWEEERKELRARVEALTGHLEALLEERG